MQENRDMGYIQATELRAVRHPLAPMVSTFAILISALLIGLMGGFSWATWQLWASTALFSVFGISAGVIGFHVGLYRQSGPEIIGEENWGGHGEVMMKESTIDGEET